MSLVKNLFKDFGDFKLSVPELKLADQGLTLLWGPSGAGKTSLIRALIGLDDCRGMEWTFGSIDVAKMTPSQREISVVFQNLSLFPHLTAHENIIFPLEARKKSLKDYRKDFHALTDLLGVTEFLNKKCQVLSGGEKQRVALARALITRPRMIVLDEPFSALDIQLKKQARELLRAIMTERQTPMLLVSHDPIDAEQLAQEVIILEKGQIKTTQTPQEFLKSL
jgi:sulfate transport system ATP-binding protein/putative spermidine/putrescine transport system ATP-binding protein